MFVYGEGGFELYPAMPGEPCGTRDLIGLAAYKADTLIPILSGSAFMGE